MRQLHAGRGSLVGDQVVIQAGFRPTPLTRLNTGRGVGFFRL